MLVSWTIANFHKFISAKPKYNDNNKYNKNNNNSKKKSNELFSIQIFRISE